MNSIDKHMKKIEIGYMVDPTLHVKKNFRDQAENS